MFLATGPTGCGKSTTLYAMLMELRKQRINILTIEDPVEMHIDDIQQMQVNRAVGFTFIWVGLLIFAIDGVWRSRNRPVENTA